MALAWREKKSLGLHLIDAEIERLSALILDRKADLKKAEAHVSELQDTCARLENKILELNHDRQAIVGGQEINAVVHNRTIHGFGNLFVNEINGR